MLVIEEIDMQMIVQISLNKYRYCIGIRWIEQRWMTDLLTIWIAKFIAMFVDFLARVWNDQLRRHREIIDQPAHNQSYHQTNRRSCKAKDCLSLQMNMILLLNPLD